MSQFDHQSADRCAEEQDGEAWRYYFVDKRSLAIKYVPAEQEADFFRAIESLTGLDRPMAERLLAGGQKIDHPSYEFHGVEEKPSRRLR